ncbi:hypothetical protein EJC47_19715 [Sphingomonas sp. TF3]|uniref:hypothetical protein n=1 Tax=Sphingomonas sp. TF3 TaxID=2495580 RepID=UPI000F87A8E1|nr:hypothetical protein [Sphingomonas sp. TF3]RUN74785.1 hypothetical protein EJC47_19715 [Sphingomonas sp. TF3]
MSIRAHIPIRLTISPALASGSVDAVVRDAVASAVSRAIGTLEDEVLVPRGGYAYPRFNAPEISWSGGPVDAEWRQAIEARIAEAIDAATQPASDRAAQRLVDAPTVVPPDPSESFDPTRVHRDGYLVGSYQGNVPSPDVPLGFDSEGAATDVMPPGYRVGWWHWHSNNLDDVAVAVVRALNANYGTSGTPPTRIGAMFRATYHGINGFMMAVFADVTRAGVGYRGRIIALYPLPGDFEGHNLEGNNPQATQRLGVLPVGLFSIERLADYTTRADRVAAVRRWGLAQFHIAPDPVAGEPAATAARRLAITNIASSMGGQSDDPGTVAILHSSTGGDYVTFVNQAMIVGRSLDVLPIAAFQRNPEQEGAGSGDGEGEGEGESEGGGGHGQGRGQGHGQEPGAGEAAGGLGTDGGSGEPDGSADGSAAFHYPFVAGGQVMTLDLGPFEGEPSLDQLGTLGDELRRLMQRIAFRLDMPMGQYCGAFLLAAAHVMGGRASAVAEAAEILPNATRVAAAGTGNLGDLEIDPQVTPAVRLLRYLGGTCPLIERAARLMTTIYQLPEVSLLITGFRRADTVGWMLDFYKQHTPSMKGAVGTIYVRACQIMMLQLLRSSRDEIDARLDNFDDYYLAVRSLVQRMVVREADLLELRTQLQSARSFTSLDANIDLAVSTWRDARHVLTTTFSDWDLHLAAMTSPARLLERRGNLEHYPDGWKVRDTHGRLWTMAELEQEIAVRHGTAASLDPLIQHFNDIPAVAATFRDSPEMSRRYLRSLLEEMRDNNRTILRQAKDDNYFAFRSGRIVDDLPHRTVPGTSIAMQGIHLLAHEAIAPGFSGSEWYAIGLQFAFDVELGRQGIISFGEAASVMALSVLCPPLGVALGIVIAGVHAANALNREELFGALIDPDVAISRAEMEFEMFLAQFEVALAIIPEAGSLMRGASRVGRIAAAESLSAGLRGFSVYARRTLLVSMGRSLQGGLIRAFVTNVLVDRVLSVVLPRLIGPIFEQVNREITVLAGGQVTPEGPAGPVAPVVAEDGTVTIPVDPNDADPYALSPSQAELERRLQEYQEGERDDEPSSGGAP